MSLSVVVVNGKYDDDLKWPFRLKITFTLHNMEDGDDVSVPPFDCNPITKPELFETPPEIGYSKFVPLKFLGKKSDYLLDDDDMIFVKCEVSVIQ